MDIQLPLPSEKFELLSAYLDGEVSPAERQQVEEWLATDVETQHLYRQMTALQKGLTSAPAPLPSVPTEQLITQVMERVDRQPKLWVWGGAAAAVVVATFSGLLTGGNPSGLFQTAQNPQPPQSAPVTVQPKPEPPIVAQRPKDPDAALLMIALERPPVNIPVVPMSHNSQEPESSVGSEF